MERETGLEPVTLCSGSTRSGQGTGRGRRGSTSLSGGCSDSGAWSGQPGPCTRGRCRRAGRRAGRGARSAPSAPGADVVGAAQAPVDVAAAARARGRVEAGQEAPGPPVLRPLVDAGVGPAVLRPLRPAPPAGAVGRPPPPPARGLAGHPHPFLTPVGVGLLATPSRRATLAALSPWPGATAAARGVAMICSAVSRFRAMPAPSSRPESSHRIRTGLGGAGQEDLSGLLADTGVPQRDSSAAGLRNRH